MARREQTQSQSNQPPELDVKATRDTLIEMNATMAQVQSALRDKELPPEQLALLQVQLAATAETTGALLNIAKKLQGRAIEGEWSDMSFNYRESKDLWTASLYFFRSYMRQAHRVAETTEPAKRASGIEALAIAYDNFFAKNDMKYALPHDAVEIIEMASKKAYWEAKTPNIFKTLKEVKSFLDRNMDTVHFHLVDPSYSSHAPMFHALKFKFSQALLTLASDKPAKSAKHAMR